MLLHSDVIPLVEKLNNLLTDQITSRNLQAVITEFQANFSTFLRNESLELFITNLIEKDYFSHKIKNFNHFKIIIRKLIKKLFLVMKYYLLHKNLLIIL